MINPDRFPDSRYVNAIMNLVYLKTLSIIEPVVYEKAAVMLNSTDDEMAELGMQIIEELCRKHDFTFKQFML